jgi:poly(A) polymerase
MIRDLASKGESTGNAPRKRRRSNNNRRKRSDESGGE